MLHNVSAQHTNSVFAKIIPEEESIAVEFRILDLYTLKIDKSQNNVVMKIMDKQNKLIDIVEKPNHFWTNVSLKE